MGQKGRAGIRKADDWGSLRFRAESYDALRSYVFTMRCFHACGFKDCSRKPDWAYRRTVSINRGQGLAAIDLASNHALRLIEVDGLSNEGTVEMPSISIPGCPSLVVDDPELASCVADDKFWIRCPDLAVIKDVAHEAFKILLLREEPGMWLRTGDRVFYGKSGERLVQIVAMIGNTDEPNYGESDQRLR